MLPIARLLLLASSLVWSASILAQELDATTLKQFTAKIDAAIANRDVDTIKQHIAENAVISGTMQVQGQMRTFRMNKTQYVQALTITWSAASSYTYKRTNEKISIDGDQATITADVADTAVIQGQSISTKARERVTVENFGGTLMLTQMVMNHVM